MELGGMEIATKPQFKARRLLEIEDVYGRLDLVCNITENK